jgi:hypothetical protein
MHKRRFITASIAIEDCTIYGNAYVVYHEHGEEQFINHMSQNAHIDEHIRKLKSEFGIKGPKYKVYGAVVDLHSTYDMCVSCYLKLFDFLNNFKGQLVGRLAALGFLTSIYPRFAMILRYSSANKYDYLKDTDPKKRGVIHLHQPRELKDSSRDICDNETMIVHSTPQWLTLWNSKIKDSVMSDEIKLENWTAFSSTSGVKGKRKEDCVFPYTLLGEVEIPPGKKAKFSPTSAPTSDSAITGTSILVAPTSMPLEPVKLSTMPGTVATTQSGPMNAVPSAPQSTIGTVCVKKL